MRQTTSYEDVTVVPRGVIELPLALPLPEGFDSALPETWPPVTGRLEYVLGRLLYMSPCGDDQQQVAADVLTELGVWRRGRPEFVVGGSEAGMMLGGDVRGADAAVWRRSELPPAQGGFPRTPPALAVEVAGKDEPVEVLQSKARWYLDHGVQVVWLLVPATRTVLVMTESGTTEVAPGDRVPAHPALPGLEPAVADLFRQVDGG